MVSALCGEYHGVDVRGRRGSDLRRAVMNTCSTCLCWGSRQPTLLDDEGADVRSEHRGCVRIIHGNGYAPDGSMAGKLATPAMMFDGSGYAATLYTLPTLSLIHI